MSKITDVGAVYDPQFERVEMRDKLRAAAQAALEELIASESNAWNVINDIESALAEPEPVAWYHNDFGVLEFSRHERVGWSPLYTASPRKEWVGLTDEEKYDCYLKIDVWSRCVEAVETKLREKNT